MRLNRAHSQTNTASGVRRGVVRARHGRRWVRRRAQNEQADPKRFETVPKAALRSASDPRASWRTARQTMTTTNPRPAAFRALDRFAYERSGAAAFIRYTRSAARPSPPGLGRSGRARQEPPLILVARETRPGSQDELDEELDHVHRLGNSYAAVPALRRRVANNKSRVRRGVEQSMRLARWRPARCSANPRSGHRRDRALCHRRVRAAALAFPQKRAASAACCVRATTRLGLATEGEEPSPEAQDEPPQSSGELKDRCLIRAAHRGLRRLHGDQGGRQPRPCPRGAGSAGVVASARYRVNGRVGRMYTAVSVAVLPLACGRGPGLLARVPACPRVGSSTRAPDRLGAQAGRRSRAAGSVVRPALTRERA
jgi:hypothetical protein